MAHCWPRFGCCAAASCLLLCLGLCGFTHTDAQPAEAECESKNSDLAITNGIDGVSLVQHMPQQVKLYLMSSATEPGGNTRNSSTEGNRPNSSTNNSVEDLEKHIQKTVKSVDEVVKHSRGQVRAMVNKTNDEENATDSAPFASASFEKNSTQEEMEVRVQIATPTDIVSIFLLMFVPLIMAWTYYFYSEASEQQQGQLYLLLIQLSFATTTVGALLVNQSLSVLMRAPMALTCVQAFSMFAGSGIVIVARQLYRLALAQSHSQESEVTAAAIGRGLFLWSPASVGFVVFQLADHFVSNDCSLSERTVFANVTPLVTLVTEVGLSKFLAPRSTDTTSASFSSKMALFLTLFGSVLFAMQDPDFTLPGLRASVLLMFSAAAYRMFQRGLIDRLGQMSSVILICYDGLLLFLVSLLLSIPESSDLWASWAIWLGNSSILVMIILSMLTFSFGHLTAVLLVRESTATLTTVIANIAGCCCIVQGILFFGDNAFKQPLLFISISLSIAGGIWYSANQDFAIAESHKDGQVNH